MSLSRFKKAIVTSMLSLSLLSSFSIVSFAETTGALINDPSLTPEKRSVLEKEAKEKDAKIEKSLETNKKSLEVSINYNPEGEFYYIPVTGYKQETTYWCGPAAAKQVLSFHKSKSGSSTAIPSQSTLAQKAGTTTSGSTTVGLKNALNAYASTFGYTDHQYVVANVTGYTNPVSTFESRIIYALKNQYNAPLVLLETKYLTRYNGKAIRHYNTVSAYSNEYATGDKSLLTEDPHYDNQYYGEHWDPLGSTSTNGVFRAVYYADVNGTNYAMAY